MDVAVAELETEEILERLEQRLVEMKVRQFDLFVQKRRHGIVNALDSLFRNSTIFVTRSLHEMGTKNAPDLVVLKTIQHKLYVRKLTRGRSVTKIVQSIFFDVAKICRELNIYHRRLECPTQSLII